MKASWQARTGFELRGTHVTMPRQFAAKKLTRSDLTLFEEQFRKQNAGNQKSINLNRRVFVDLMLRTAPTRVRR